MCTKFLNASWKIERGRAKQFSALLLLSRELNALNKQNLSCFISFHKTEASTYAELPVQVINSIIRANAASSEPDKKNITSLFSFLQGFLLSRCCFSVNNGICHFTLRSPAASGKNHRLTIEVGTGTPPDV